MILYVNLSALTNSSPPLPFNFQTPIQPFHVRRLSLSPLWRFRDTDGCVDGGGWFGRDGRGLGMGITATSVLYRLATWWGCILEGIGVLYLNRRLIDWMSNWLTLKVLVATIDTLGHFETG